MCFWVKTFMGELLDNLYFIILKQNILFNLIKHALSPFYQLKDIDFDFSFRANKLRAAT